ncbi:MAG: hypothetical protein HYY23_09105 [Verrucomicrobia bacterium]|nr:hypothetical protein [Verrucomicrobiota bacterium]
MKHIHKIIIGAAGLVSATTLFAENAVVLESFEQNIDAVALGDWGGGRIPDGVTLKQYTKSGTDDPNVTQGNKSLQVDLSVAEWWVHDFKITLSEDASNKVRQAAKSTDVARYIFRYDIIFPAGTAWMNNAVYFGSNNDQLESNNGKRTMSLALDLISGFPDEGQIVIRFADNFDATEDPFVGPLTVYVDNLRLVDTYAAGAKPVTYVLQSFEDSKDPTGGAQDFTGWGGTPRTTYSQYTRTSPDDFHVSEGTHALKVDYANAGTWHADFTLPLNNTKLAEILKLDSPPEERPTAAQLERYTLRFDVAYPDRADDWTAGWMNTSYHTLATAFPFSQVRRDRVSGERQTMSLTLDQLTWQDTAEVKPVLMFIANGAWGPTGTTVYYDNFRLIDTGNVAITAPAPKITGVQYDAKTRTITLRWDSAAGKTYAVDYTQALGSWPTVMASGVQGVQGTTTYNGSVPSATSGFFRIRLTN